MSKVLQTIANMFATMILVHNLLQQPYNFNF